MEIKVYGTPAPQGSKRFMGIKGGKGILIESSKAVKPWREAVKWAAREALEAEGRTLYATGPVWLEVTFTLPRPKSASKSRTVPDRKPDLSKLVRATEDALTDAGVWEDDARVVRTVSEKVYPGVGGDSLPVPGAVIRILDTPF